jgi:hypothetical protein
LVKIFILWSSRTFTCYCLYSSAKEEENLSLSTA